MVIRFQLLSEEDLKKLSESAEHQNTKKGTNNWVMNGRSILSWRK